MNADDVEACVAAIRLALAYRETFGRDAVIDLIGYRRFGHNETDEPAYTQPLMYERIKEPPAGAQALRRQAGGRGHGRAPRTPRRSPRPPTRRVADAHEELKHSIGAPPETGEHELDRTMSREPRTTLPEDTLRSLERAAAAGARRLRGAPQAQAVHRAAPHELRGGQGHRLGARRGARLRLAARARRAGAAHRPGHRARHVQPAPRRAARPEHRRALVLAPGPARRGGALRAPQQPAVGAGAASASSTATACRRPTRSCSGRPSSATS